MLVRPGGITRDRPISNEAAIKYFLLGSFASALLLYGIGLVYGVTGATDFAGHRSAVSRAASGKHPLLLVAWRWWPAGSPSRSRRCRSTPGLRTPTRVPARRSRHSWPPAPRRGPRSAGRVCLGRFRARAARLVGHPGGAGGIVDGGREPARVSQTNMKRLLAYSSIAHAGLRCWASFPELPRAPRRR